MEGRSITNLNDLNHGSFYVISGSNKFIELNYGAEDDLRKPFTNNTFMIPNMTADDIRLMKPLTPQLPPQPPPPPPSSLRHHLMNGALPPMSSSVPPPFQTPSFLDSRSLNQGTVANRLLNQSRQLNQQRNGVINPTGGKLVTVIHNNNHDVM